MVDERDGFGARLERARSRAGLNKNQLARAIGTSWQHIDHWEQGRVLPSSSSLQRLAGAIGVSVAYLLGEERRDSELPPARETSEALSVFLDRYAPEDLTEAEMTWLRSAPIEASAASPGLYLDLLHRLRSSAPATAKRPGTGPRAKVRTEDLPEAARAVLAAQKKSGA